MVVINARYRSELLEQNIGLALSRHVGDAELFLASALLPAVAAPTVGHGSRKKQLI